VARKQALRRLGETRMTGTPQKIRAILERISDPFRKQKSIFGLHQRTPAFKEVGERMLQEWMKAATLTSSRLMVVPLVLAVREQ